MAQEQELVSTIARSDGQELVPIDTAELPAFLAMPVGCWDLPGAVGRRCLLIVPIVLRSHMVKSHYVQ
jgi:hypothetical protein